MENFKKALKSRQFWTIVVVFIMNGVDGIREFIPEQFLPYINSVFSMLIIYFRISPKQDFSSKKKY